MLCSLRHKCIDCQACNAQPRMHLCTHAPLMCRIICSWCMHARRLASMEHQTEEELSIAHALQGSTVFAGIAPSLLCQASPSALCCSADLCQQYHVGSVMSLSGPCQHGSRLQQTPQQHKLPPKCSTTIPGGSARQHSLPRVCRRLSMQACAGRAQHVHASLLGGGHHPVSGRAGGGG